MELLLNLVWLVVAVTSLTLGGWQILRTAGRKEFRASKWHSLIALCCLLVILFFVISMTDDINDQQVASEECQSLGLLLRNGAQDSHAKHSHHSDSCHVVWVNPKPESIPCICLGYIEPLFVIDPTTLETTPLSARAPPFLSA